LYVPKKRTIKLDKEERVHHVVGTDKVTRGMVQPAQMGQAGPSYPAEGAMEEEVSSTDISMGEYLPIMHTSGAHTLLAHGAGEAPTENGGG
jgi:hypothetical protein